MKNSGLKNSGNACSKLVCLSPLRKSAILILLQLIEDIKWVLYGNWMFVNSQKKNWKSFNEDFFSVLLSNNESEERLSF